MPDVQDTAELKPVFRVTGYMVSVLGRVGLGQRPVKDMQVGSGQLMGRNFCPVSNSAV